MLSFAYVRSTYVCMYIFACMHLTSSSASSFSNASSFISIFLDFGQRFSRLTQFNLIGLWQLKNRKQRAILPQDMGLLNFVNFYVLSNGFAWLPNNAKTYFKIILKVRICTLHPTPEKDDIFTSQECNTKPEARLNDYLCQNVRKVSKLPATHFVSG